MQTIKTIVAYALYIALITALLPFVILLMLWRFHREDKSWSRFVERLGWMQNLPAQGGTWLHAASVGEVNAAEPVIRDMLAKHGTPTIVVTTMTATGSARVRELFGDTVNHFYAPIDWPPFTALFLFRLRPKLAIIMETELWPVTIASCRWLRIPVLLANARLSQSSADGYRKIAWLSRPMMSMLSVATHHHDDAKRFIESGAAASTVRVTGSLKFEIELSQQTIDAASIYRESIEHSGKGFTWVAASTHEGEEEVVLSAHRQLLQQYPDSLLILVPRHPQRFESVAQLCQQQDFSMQLYSQSKAVAHDTELVLVDAMGELVKMYGVADIAFVGGSLIPVGGHNLLEPAAWACPVLSGPHVFNFEAIATQLRGVKALRYVGSGDEMLSALLDARENSEQLVLSGQAARRLLDENKGAQEQLMDIIEQLLAR